MQGKIAGVDIVSQGGAPGGSTRVMVRGIGTLNNSSPLYIVDGMYMSGIDHINPNDIASIDVLKDASSAAIYGSRAANGVVIVTTKEGSNTEGKSDYRSIGQCRRQFAFQISGFIGCCRLGGSDDRFQKGCRIESARNGTGFGFKTG